MNADRTDRTSRVDRAAGAVPAAEPLPPVRRRSSTIGNPAPRVARALGLLAIFALSWVAVGCAGPGQRTRTTRPSPARSAGIYGETFAEVTAPARGDPRDELELVERGRGHGARLREAWLLLEVGRARSAEQLLNRVIFDADAPRRDVEAIARFLRAKAFEGQRDAERAASERERAAELAVDPLLIAALRETSGRRGVPTEASHTIRLFGRNTWGAAASRGPMEPIGPITRITIHHSAVLARSDGQKATAASIRSIQRYHMKSNGWSDLGYHYLVDPEGRVWEGRPARWQGAHTGGQNPGNLGICLLGNFVPNASGQSPTRAQLATLENLVQALLAQHRLPVGAVKTHGELASTTECPGARLQREVDEMRRRLARGHLASR
jgi:hypothetical protein